MKLSVTLVAVACSVAWICVGARAPAQSDSIVVGGDSPESREVSICARDMTAERQTKWRATVVQALCKSNDPSALLSVFALSAGMFDGTPDWSTLDRAYRLGKKEPTVLWTVVVSSKCHLPFQASECNRMVNAGRQLTLIDPNNAMAWITLGYAIDQSAGDDAELRNALARATEAPKFHDYGYDITRDIIKNSERAPMPAESIADGLSADQLRMYLIASFEPPTKDITDWLYQIGGCISADKPPEPNSDGCIKAKALLSRGDSAATLIANEMLMAKITAVTSKEGTSPAMATKSVRAYETSSNELEFAEKISEK